MFLHCPECGFSFGLFTNETDEEILKELMTCPCGCMMEESRRRDFYMLNDEVNELKGRVYALEREVCVHKPPVSGSVPVNLTAVKE